MKPLAPIPILLILLVGCGTIERVFEPSEPTLADLDPVELPMEDEALPEVSLQELRAIYRDLLPQQHDTKTRQSVMHRLADIEMLAAEAKLAEGDEQEALFAAAITAYEALLRENPDYEPQDSLLYQLSKAYDLNGQNDKSQAVLERLSSTSPESSHAAEANFRRAEHYFVNSNYAKAEMTYAEVIRQGDATPYYTRALYMQGWSRFKQDKFEASIEAFTASLDQILLRSAQKENLPRGERELVDDSLRVLAIVFSNLDGTDTIATAYANLGERPYQHLLYESLGQLYLSQERYRDSAETYQAFTQHHPYSGLAHLFQLRVIEAYEAGGFSDLILLAKQDYVAAFGVESDYFENSAAPARERMTERLCVFVDELASHYHALAQRERKTSPGSARVAEYYAEAAKYYRLYIDSFPEDEATPKFAFLLAESLFEAGDYSAAIVAYDVVAYEYKDEQHAADAAYTAILAYEKLAQQLTSHNAAANEQAHYDLKMRRITAEQRFFNQFPNDARAPSVMLHAANELLSLEDYQAALTAASALTESAVPLATQLRLPAWLVSAHSLFALNEFSAAESAYSSAAALLTPDDERYAQTQERLAASIYRQGERKADMGRTLAAAEQFQRVIEAAPTSLVRVNAQFDAAAAYISAGELQKANELLVDFRRRYPQHELSQGISATLLQNYEELGHWREAAQELDRLHTPNGSDDIARQALLVSAQYYEKAGDIDTATARYRSYATQWPQPVDQHLEVLQHLASVAEQTGDAEIRHHWLRETIAAHDNAGEEQTDRSRYLAASAASVLAERDYGAFLAIPLTYPIGTSLKAKKQAMERALATYSKCNHYGVQEFSTLATYRMGHIYQQLSLDLLDSERPTDLDALAQEQYDIMLEETAYPFEEKAIAIHESNAKRARDGVYGPWVKESFAALAQLLPARYHKTEMEDTQQLAAFEGEVQPSAPRKVRALNREAIDLRQQGEFKRAESAYLRAIDKVEDYPLTHRNIGILYDLYLGQPEDALLHYSRYQSLTENRDRSVAGWIADLQRQQVSLAPHTQ